MREFIDRKTYKLIRKTYEDCDRCCYIYIDGRLSNTKKKYYEYLCGQLRLNESFSRNFNAYADMMCDPFTYYNKEEIIFVIDYYEAFLGGLMEKEIIEEIFDDRIIPFFRSKSQQTIMKEKYKEIHVYCIVSESHGSVLHEG